MSRVHDHHDVDRLLDLVRDHSGLDFPAGRRSGIERPIQAAMERIGVRTIGGLARRLSHPASRDELERFVGSLTIGETHFFRNHPQIDAIRRVVLPDLIERRRDRRVLRLWSAGCSTGEEAYSLAIALDGLLPDRAGWDVRILGTDLNDAALERARAARYGEWSFRGVPDRVRRRYFREDGAQYRLVDEIRSLVHFERLNLVGDGYPSATHDTAGMDLILCRNVLIYFRSDTVDRVVARLERSLAPDGWMITGHAESPMPVFRRLFETRELPMAVLYRKRAAVDERSDRIDHAGGRTGSHVPLPAAPVDAPVADAPEPPLPRAEASAPAPSTAPREPVVARATDLFALGNREAALALLRAAADRAPADPEPLIVAARLLAGVLQYEAAEHVIRIAIDRAPGTAQAHYVHALVLEGLGRRAQAVEALRRTSYLDPEHVLACFTLASLLDETGRGERAHAALDRLVELLADEDDDTVIDTYEGLTVGRLLALTDIRRQLIHDEARA